MFCLDDAEIFWKWDRYNLSDRYCLSSSVIKWYRETNRKRSFGEGSHPSILINSWLTFNLLPLYIYNSDPTLLFLNSFMCFIILSVTQSLKIMEDTEMKQQVFSLDVKVPLRYSLCTTCRLPSCIHIPSPPRS